MNRIEQLGILLPSVTVQSPNKRLSISERLKWTFVVLVAYYFIVNIHIFGLGPAGIDLYEYLRVVTAGEYGSLFHIGTAPLITAINVLFLLEGGGILVIDRFSPFAHKRKENIKKGMIFLFLLWFCVISFLNRDLPPDLIITNTMFGGNEYLTMFVIFLQIVIGSIILIFLEDVSTKWGICSGYALLIIAYNSENIINGLFAFEIFENDIYPFGFFPRLASIWNNNGNFWTDCGFQLLSVLTTIAIFFILIYVLSTRIDIPLAHAQVRGSRARFPVKLLYAGVGPIIMTIILLFNIHIILAILFKITGMSVLKDLSFIFSQITGPTDWMWWSFDTGYSGWINIVRLFILFITLVFGCIFFSLYYIHTAGTDTKFVARQIMASQMAIPGYERNPIVLEKYLERFIPRITVIGGFVSGVLLFFSSLFGMVGGLTLVGLLLTIDFIYQIWNEFEHDLRELLPFFKPTDDETIE